MLAECHKGSRLTNNCTKSKSSNISQCSKSCQKNERWLKLVKIGIRNYHLLSMIIKRWPGPLPGQHLTHWFIDWKRFYQLNLIEGNVKSYPSRGKQMPNWKRPYVGKNVFSRRALILTKMGAKDLPNPVNSGSFKKYFT
ncbi:protein NYNRIN-like [Gossypium australe]|uniref:Protein NYNRIN-like n=1 Tax=Gossypium australe TaxID=47621 RepID=A0A5B6WGH0_9ROSI|nr:protein NYNRIN-like [Gossypium australe]